MTKEELIDGVNEMIISTPKGTIIIGDGLEITTLFAKVIGQISKHIPKEILKDLFDYALKSEEEQNKILIQELKKICEKMEEENE